MMFGKSIDLGKRPFFVEMPVFTLGARQADGKLETGCTKTTNGPAVACYLSLVHTLIDAHYWRGRGVPYGAGIASTIDRELFVAENRRELIAEIRLGWPVCGRRLVREMDGNTASLAIVVRQAIVGEVKGFELAEPILEEVDLLHERAGIFAWREAYRNMASWDEQRVLASTARALNAIETTRARRSDCHEIALYDAEFEQWHFVPLSAI